MIIVEYRSEILGNGEFWRGPEDKISEIRNLPARVAAAAVVADGKPKFVGMWAVRQEKDAS